MRLPQRLGPLDLRNEGRFSRRNFLAGLGAAAAVFHSPEVYSQLRHHRFSVKDLGAKGDAVSLDTFAIQHAIDFCSSSGGGTVWFPAGGYVTGTILLKTGVTLELDRGATLLGSLNPSDYRLLEAFVDGVGATRGFALIGCIDVNDVGIKGRGVIDGRGAALQAAGGGAPSAKPFLLLCSRSTAVAIEGIRLANSSAWTLHISQCSDVTVSSVAIHSVGLANNDGIDIDSSQRVRVENCTIESGDDAICLKTTSNTLCTDIVIKDCTMTTRCAAFKIGTESAGDFSAIHVSDCHVIEANLGAVKILSVDGANISNVLVERLRVESADTPIFLRLGTRGRVFRQGASVRPPGTLTNVTIRDVEVKEARRIGILVAGVPGHPIERVSFERINITMVGEAVTQVPPEPIEAPASYPEVRMFGTTLPAYGIYGRHVRALEMKQIQIQGTPGDARPRQFFSNDSSLLLERQAPLR